MQPDCNDLHELLVSLDKRVQAVEHSHTRMKDAFVLNDLKVADYDGHRVAHLKAIERDAITQTYQRNAAGAGIKWVVGGGLTAVASALLMMLKDHLK